MKKSIFLFLAIIIFSTSSFSQRKSKSKKSEESKTYVSALINIDPEEFEIEQTVFSSFAGDSARTVHTSIFPRNITSIGFSIQIVKRNKTYQELSLTKLAYTEVENQLEFIDDNVNAPRDSTIFRGETNAIWDIKARYEFGKYFLPDNNKLNIGLSIAAAPGFLASSFDPKISTLFPLKTFRTNLNLTVAPTVIFDITDNLALALKVIPNVFNIEWNRQRIENPALTERQKVTNDFESSFFDSGIITNIIARYRIGTQSDSEDKGKKKRRRR